jgi:hypothetical protein
MNRLTQAPRLAAVTAALLLALIVADLGDAACDPLPAQSSALAVMEARADRAEACGSSCVPDCFCCSRPLPAAAPHSLDGPRLVARSIFFYPAGLTAEFPDVIDHVPLASL